MGDDSTEGGDSTHTRRRLLASLGVAASGLAAGCPGILSSESDGDAGTETAEPIWSQTDTPTLVPTATPDSETAETATPSPTDTATPTATGVVWRDTFEDGSLAEYDTTEIIGDDDTQGYHLREEPSRGSHALAHRTESVVLHPAEPVSFDPPVTAYFDVYIDQWSGVDLLLQWNREAALSYQINVRRNANGGFLRVQKRADEDSSDSATLAKETRGKEGPDVVEGSQWERVEVRWTDDELAARMQSNGATVSIADDDERLRGTSFGIQGYHYSGFAAMDNLVIKRGDWDIPSSPHTATPTPAE